MEIVQTDFDSQNAKALSALLRTQWADFIDFDRGFRHRHVPWPLVALDNGEVIGGVAFSLYSDPRGSNKVVWLNALFVVPVCRGKGVGSSLIVAAADISPILYALTEVPELYIASGWKAIDVTNDGTIVSSL